MRIRLESRNCVVADGLFLSEKVFWRGRVAGANIVKELPLLDRSFRDLDNLLNRCPIQEPDKLIVVDLARAVRVSEVDDLVDFLLSELERRSQRLQTHSELTHIQSPIVIQIEVVELRVQRIMRHLAV